jgi:hypothetical protein
MQVGKPQSGENGTWQREALMLLQTLRTRDPDELAEGFRRWDLRFRQLGGGPFRGELQFLQLGATQILRASGNRRLQARGSLPPAASGSPPCCPGTQPPAGAAGAARRARSSRSIRVRKATT